MFSLKIISIEKMLFLYLVAQPHHFPCSYFGGTRSLCCCLCCVVLLWEVSPAQQEDRGVWMWDSLLPCPEVLVGNPCSVCPYDGEHWVYLQGLSSVRSYLLSSSRRISPEQIDLTVLHFPGPFASCPVGYLPLEGTFWHFTSAKGIK